MPRFAMILEYNGRGYVGWQMQAQQNSLQQAVQNAIAELEPGAPNIVAAGRTDSGVHALGQVIHCDLQKDWQPRRLCDALNWHLRQETIAIVQVATVDADFSARFSAHRRAYLYRIIVRSTPLVLDGGLAWRRNQDLDVPAMQEAAQMLIGKHDFSTFRSIKCQADSPVKTLDQIEIAEKPISHGVRELQIRAEARSFLHRQVRSIVGTLERVGARKMSLSEFKDVFRSCDRQRCGTVAPAEGLFLEKVNYKPDPFNRSSTCLKTN